MNFSCVAFFLPIAKDLVLTATALVGVYVALRGLSTWDRQLKGGVEYELTRRLLRCTYRLREGFKIVRISVMSPDEMSTSPDEGGKNGSLSNQMYQGMAKAYQARWTHVTDAHNELRAELLEAEVLWGKEIHTKYERLFNLQHELFNALRSHLRIADPNENEHVRQSIQSFSGKRRDVLYESSDPDDAFAQDVAEAIASIEDFLKPRLRQ